MSVNAVGGGTYGNLQAQTVQRTPEAAEVGKAGRDNDGDADDGGAKVTSATLAPTVNMNGQKLGQFINVSA